MKLNNEPWIPDKQRTESLPLPPLPKEGYTYAIDGRTGKPVKAAPSGKCGHSCMDCWPYGWDEEEA